MALNYIVVLDQAPMQNVFRDNYFPRAFHYKKDADTLMKEVEQKGGKAHVIPKSQVSIELLKQVKG